MEGRWAEQCIARDLFVQIVGVEGVEKELEVEMGLISPRTRQSSEVEGSAEQCAD